MAKRPSTCLLSNDLFALKLDQPRGKLRIIRLLSGEPDALRGVSPVRWGVPGNLSQ